MLHKQNYSANGKLLLTGEYLVLEGANALALPTKLGQQLSITLQQTDTPFIRWKSFNADGFCWFESIFHHNTFEVINATSSDVARLLVRIFEIVQSEKQSFDNKIDYEFNTTLDFDRNWGLGTSSTLISLMSQWSGVDPYVLLQFTFGGSGYDVACATKNIPFVYNKNHRNLLREIVIHPNITNKLYFVYLNKKMNSRTAMEHFNDIRPVEIELIDEINMISNQIETSSEFDSFCDLIQKHENIISELIELPKVKDIYFEDFDGAIKSLGAWGGDFILVASSIGFESTKDYFHNKGFKVFYDYKTLIH